MSRKGSIKEKDHELNVKIAKELYFQHYTLQFIANKLGCSRDYLSHVANKEGWLIERDQHDDEIVRAYAKDKASDMANIGKMCLNLVRAALEARQKTLETEPMTLQEAKMVAEIFADVDKIIKLDNGEATDRITIAPVDLKDLRDAIKKDKFLNVIPIEVEPVLIPEKTLQDNKD